MTTDLPPMTSSPTTWLKPRPASWVLWPFAVAIENRYPIAIMLWFGWAHRPTTALGWIGCGVLMFAGLALSDRLRDPIFENAYVRRLVARTDGRAMLNRVAFVLAVLLLPIACVVLPLLWLYAVRALLFA